MLCHGRIAQACSVGKLTKGALILSELRAKKVILFVRYPLRR